MNDLYICVQPGGREFSALNTTNREAAAIKAHDIFTFLKKNGWDNTLVKFKPNAEWQVKLDVSVGGDLNAVESTRKLSGGTFLG